MINTPKAEGPARNEPEQSPSLPSGSPSGVVDALRPFAEAYQRLVSIPTGVFPILVSGAELAAANQAFIAASLPQAPAQAPDVEGAADTSTMIVPDGDLAEWVFSIKPGSRADAFVSGFNAAVSMLGKYQGPTAPSVAVAWERYKKSLPAPGSQGEEAPAPGVVEALRFYADEDNYYGKYNGEKKRLPAITEDMGDLARQALAALQNQQEEK